MKKLEALRLCFEEGSPSPPVDIADLDAGRKRIVSEQLAIQTANALVEVSDLQTDDPEAADELRTRVIACCGAPEG